MKVMQIGLGSIGKAVTRLLLKKPRWHITAAFDVDPAKQGRDLGEVVEVDQRLGVPVRGDFLDFQQYNDVDVALITTVSTLPEIFAHPARPDGARRQHRRLRRRVVLSALPLPRAGPRT